MVGRYVRVTWVDACHGGQWYSEDELPTPDKVISTGWLAKEGTDYIVLCASRYEMGGQTNWGQTIAIPSGMIVAMEEYNG